MSEDAELLKTTLDYETYADIMTSAWLAAEEVTKHYPPREFRIAFFTILEKSVKEEGKKNGADS